MKISEILYKERRYILYVKHMKYINYDFIKLKLVVLIYLFVNYMKYINYDFIKLKLVVLIYLFVNYI